MALITWSTTDLSPSGVWAFSGGNTVATESTSSSSSIRATSGKSTGKFYFEISVSAAGAFDAFVGFIPSGVAVTNINLVSAYCLRANGSTVGFSSPFSFASGDTIGFAVDADAGKAWIRLNGGAWAGGGDPAAGTSPSASGLTPGVTWMPAAGADNNSTDHTFTAKFSPATFQTAAPAGFAAISDVYQISGTVRDAAGSFAARSVRAYVRSTGILAATAVSNATTGEYVLPVGSSDHHVVMVLPDGSETAVNAQILDRITPLLS